MNSSGHFVRTRYNDGDLSSSGKPSNSGVVKFLENEPNFKIIGKNKEGEFEIQAVRYFGVSSRPKKVIILGNVSRGQLFNDNKIILVRNDGYSIDDKIIRIEIKRKRQDVAIFGDNIGICLSTTTIRQLRRFNNP